MCIRHERFYHVEQTVEVAGEQVPVPPFTLIGWAALTRARLKKPPENCPRFPVVIDSGFSHNLYIREWSGRHWAGLAIARANSSGAWEGMVADASGYLLSRMPDDLCVEDANGNEIVCPVFAADLWLYPNNPRSQVKRLALDEGFSLVPAPAGPGEPAGPRIPLLGGLALHVNDMKLVADYKNLDFSLDEQV